MGSGMRGQGHWEEQYGGRSEASASVGNARNEFLSGRRDWIYITSQMTRVPRSVNLVNSLYMPNGDKITMTGLM